MAVDKLVDSTQLDADLTAVANAIRTKGGTSAQLAFPAGFVSAVQDIPTGTTPTLITKTITENGTYDAEDDDADGYSEVTVNVSGGGDGFLIGGQTVRIKNNSGSQRLCMRVRNVNYGVTHLGTYSTNIASGSTLTSQNYFATFEKNGNKYITFHTGYNPASITYNGDPVAYVTTGSAAQWDVEVTLPSGFDNSYTLDIG